MSMLERGTRGKIKKPLLILVYGIDGCGKSTFGSEAPKPAFLGAEQGTDNLDVFRFPEPKNWADVLECVDDLSTKPHDFETLVIDSLDWVEPLLHRKICADYGVKSIELAAGGYGKGYIEALAHWNDLKDRLNRLRADRKMNIILLAHSEVVKFNDPQSQMEYDRYQLKLHKKAGALMREWVDAVLFANFGTYIKKEGDQVKAFAGGRVLHVERGPGWDAKNRYGLIDSIPDVRWSKFYAAYDKGDPETIQAVLSRINGLMVDLKEDVKEKVQATVEKAKGDISSLKAIEKRLQALGVAAS